MKPYLSIILPSIRPERLVGLYESILKSTKRSFELVICGPYALPDELQELKNVKYIKDFGSPTRASQLAANFCEGEVVTWIADDALLIEGALDACLDEFEGMWLEGERPKAGGNVLVAKYYEGQMGSLDRETLHPDKYFKVCGSPADTPSVSEDWWLFNIAFMKLDHFRELGGWDCAFEGTWCAHTDLAIRAQIIGCTIKMAQIPLMRCDHMPGGSGDHMPIFECQPKHDEPILRERYWDNSSVRLIKLDNWRSSPPIWSRRFNG